MEGRPDHLGDPSDVHDNGRRGRQETRLESRSIPILQRSNHQDNIPVQELGTLKTRQQASGNRQFLPHLRYHQRSGLTQALLPMRTVLEGDRIAQ